MLIFNLELEINSLYNVTALAPKNFVGILYSVSEKEVSPFDINHYYVHCKFFALGRFMIFSVNKSMAKYFVKL
jgi:hypothetical protein